MLSPDPQFEYDYVSYLKDDPGKEPISTDDFAKPRDAAGDFQTGLQAGYAKLPNYFKIWKYLDSKKGQA